MSTTTDTRRTILVIGATGAQGLPVIRHLLKPTKDGKPSPWKVRALTRDVNHRRAKELAALGVELFQGSFMDYAAIARAFSGVYGAFVNTDGFSVGEVAEGYAGVRIFEIAKAAHVRHYVWSSLDYASKKGKYDPQYAVDHYNGKGRVAEFLKAQPNDINDPNGTMWTVFTNGPYMDMLNQLFTPFKRHDGTYLFAAPIGAGHVPMIALEDLGWWARHIFDSPSSTTGRDLEVASELVGWKSLAETFTRVTGHKAEYVSLSMDDYFAMFLQSDQDAPVANEVPGGTTWRKNFEGWWSLFRDDLCERDMAWVRSVNPDTWTLERWMRETKYKGQRTQLLKNVEDNKSKLRGNKEMISKL